MRCGLLILKLVEAKWRQQLRTALFDDIRRARLHVLAQGKLMFDLRRARLCSPIKRIG